MIKNNNEKLKLNLNFSVNKQMKNFMKNPRQSNSLTKSIDGSHYVKNI